MKIDRLLVALFLAAAVTAPLATAQEKPDVNQILDGMIAKSGGRQAMAALKTRYTKASMDMPDLGIKGTMEAWETSDGKRYGVTDLTGFGKVEQGCDGKVFWEKSPMTGLRLVEGPERGVHERASLGAELQWKKHYPKRKLLGEETFEGKACWKLEMTPKAGKPETWWVEKDSGKRLKVVMTVDTPFGEIKAESVVVEFMKVDGINMAKKTKDVAGPQKIETIVHEVKHNIEIDAKKFDLPEDVKKLVEKAKKKAAEKAAKGDGAPDGPGK